MYGGNDGTYNNANNHNNKRNRNNKEYKNNNTVKEDQNVKTNINDKKNYNSTVNTDNQNSNIDNNNENYNCENNPLQQLKNYEELKSSEVYINNFDEKSGIEPKILYGDVPQIGYKFSAESKM